MNEHVFEYCKSFVTAKEKPGFALFIKGPWGCGKTFFIDSLLRSLDSELVKERVLRISLYGIVSIEEIDTKLFESLHPILSSNGVKLTSVVLRTLMKLGPSFALGNGNSTMVFSPDCPSLPHIDNKKLEKDNKIIIVDDFERASVESEAILGYFSNLIADSDNRVIFIGNEDQVKDINAFTQIKEKTIGMEFSISPDFESALNAFADSIFGNSETKAIIVDSMKSVNAVLGCQNLRIIRQALYNFELFFRRISEDNKVELSLLSTTFFALFVQKNMDMITKENTRDALSAFFNLKSRYTDYVKTKGEHEHDPYWDFLISSGYDTILPAKLWESVIFDGQFVEEDINKAISEYVERTSPAKPDPLFQLFNWIYLSSSDFETKFNNVKRNFSKGEYKHPGEIIIYTQLMFRFIKNGLIRMTIEELDREVRRVINEDLIEPMTMERWEVMNSMNSFGGYGFSTIDDEWYMQLIDDLKNKSTSKAFDALKEEFEKEIEGLSDINLFCENLQNKNGKEKYSDVAILSCLSEEYLSVFFKKLLLLESEELVKIKNCLYSRYGFDSSKLIRVVLLDEYDNFVKLLNMFEEELKNTQSLYNPRYYVLEYISKSFQELKQYFETKKQLYENTLGKNRMSFI